MEDAAIEVAIDNLPHIRPKKTILLGKAVVVNLFKLLKMILNTLIILRFQWLSRAIYRKDVGHDRFSFGTKPRYWGPIINNGWITGQGQPDRLNRLVRRSRWPIK